MQHIKFLKLKNDIVTHLAITGQYKKFLVGLVGIKNEQLNIWTMKNMLDLDKHQKLKFSLDLEGRATHLMSHKATLNRYLIVALKGGSIEVIETSSFTKYFKTDGLIKFNLTVFNESKKASKFVGSLLIACENKTFKFVKPKLELQQMNNILLDFAFPEQVDAAQCLSGGILLICLANGFMNFFNLNLDQVERSKPFIMKTLNQAQQIFTFNRGLHFLKLSQNDEWKYQLELYGGKSGNQIFWFELEAKGLIASIAKLKNQIIILSDDGYFYYYELQYDKQEN
ncbi:UNKNOWN [Stylonychia lemnae]|uniref:Uncharacterized protein n=1 Tax=Stylonychia lemnae TaxID=5949 RepID=A0A078BB83_STYLE|nr:UNKNOWN [Stylonychia lemnae]|eukprot:CDW90828.1 UNKNOWN [Stylonychia lemnae]